MQTADSRRMETFDRQFNTCTCIVHARLPAIFSNAGKKLNFSNYNLDFNDADSM